MTAAETVAAVERRCRGPLPGWARDASAYLLKTGRLAEAAAVDAQSRAECGYDFNQTVLAGPLDGLEHDYVCPGCGVSGSYTAPVDE